MTIRPKLILLQFSFQLPVSIFRPNSGFERC